MSGLSDLTRCLFAGGYDGSAGSNVIQYVTTATTGNATDFGDLTAATQGDFAGTSNGSRGVFGGGFVSSVTNTIQYVAIQTPGNATDFGDLTVSAMTINACSGT